jgi:hypothetical protein
VTSRHAVRLDPGGRVCYPCGFNGSYTGTNPQPTAFSLNNVPCAVA